MNNEKIVNAAPTKEFFIYMLTKDIPLVRAIIDLVDNCLDGAHRIRGDEDYSELWVRIEANKDSFKISDNCGGISVELARKYAFRFGRPKDMPRLKHSVGQFGVGMKRALFKIGREFKIESFTETSRFVIEEDVEKWKEKPKWEFEFKELEEKLTQPPSIDNRGTTIIVKSLNESVAEAFNLDNFINRLKGELEIAHQDSLSKGLQITLNGIPLTFSITELLQSDILKPANKDLEFDEPEKAVVKVKLYAGISDSDPSTAGWYVYCNGRCILETDKSNTTGWAEGGGRTIPQYHNQFARFRGYVFFDCDDAGRLPWNTTKTGVDIDSTIYRSVRQNMITMMRPVIDFLNRLDAEKDCREEPAMLTEAVEGAEKADLQSIVASPNFIANVESVIKTPVQQMQRIQYHKPKDQVKIVKDVLRVLSFKEVGEKTFDYFFERECDE